MEIDRVNSNQVSLKKLDEWIQSGRELPDEKILNYNGIKFLGQKESIHSFTTFVEQNVFLENKVFLSDTPIQKWSLRYEDLKDDMDLISTIVYDNMCFMLSRCESINRYANLSSDSKSEKVKKELPEHSKYITRNLLVLRNYVQRNKLDYKKFVQSEKYRQLLDIATKYNQEEFYHGEIDAWAFKKEEKELEEKENKEKKWKKEKK